jgi:uncharacterized protein
MNQLRFFLIFLAGLAVYYFTDELLFSLIKERVTQVTSSKALGHNTAYIVTMIPVFLTVFILHGKNKNIFETIGLKGSIGVGLMVAFIATLPSLIAYGIKFSINSGLSVDTIIINTITSAFFEEIFYRAFLIGLLYRFTKLGFLPSVILGSMLFGIAHLYQSTEFSELIGIFSITFLGSLLFFWVYAEWKFNLWVAIFLHCLMNLYWLVFNVDDNALGGTYANIFRFLTVFLVIAGTILYKKKKRLPFEVGRRTWWLKSTQLSQQ